MVGLVFSSSLPAWFALMPLLALPLFVILAAPQRMRRRGLAFVFAAMLSVAPIRAATVRAQETGVVIYDICADPNLPAALWWAFGCYLR